MHRRETLRGILGMGLYFNWVIYVLFYGPGLAAFSFDTSRAALLGLTAHAAGFLHSAWLYNQTASSRTLKWCDAGSLLVVLLVTVSFAFVRYPTLDAWLLFLFAAIGYASARLVVRWGAWFSSPVATPRRGSIYGALITVCYGILFLQTTFLPPSPEGARAGLLWSAVTALLGGLLIIKLPVAKGRRKRVSLSTIVPPASVAAFSLIVFPLAVLPFPFVLSVHTAYPLHLAMFFPLAYLIPLLFGRLSDRAGRHCLLVASFTLLGTGFAIWTVTPHIPPFILLVAAAVLAGNLCAALFIWTFGADRETPDTIPLGFAMAVCLQSWSMY